VLAIEIDAGALTPEELDTGPGEGMEEGRCAQGQQRPACSRLRAAPRGRVLEDNRRRIADTHKEEVRRNLCCRRVTCCLLAYWWRAGVESEAQREDRTQMQPRVGRSAVCDANEQKVRSQVRHYGGVE
jgi:hypothetical protein